MPQMPSQFSGPLPPAGFGNTPKPTAPRYRRPRGK
jgi:hypothetical protein